MGHGAGGIGLEDRAERALALFPPERVEHGHGVLESALGLGRAGDREAHPAEATQRVVMRPALLRGGNRGEDDGGEEPRASDPVDLRSISDAPAHFGQERLGVNGLPSTPHGLTMSSSASWAAP